MNTNNTNSNNQNNNNNRSDLALHQLNPAAANFSAIHNGSAGSQMSHLANSNNTHQLL